MKKIFLITICMVLLIGIVSSSSFTYKQDDVVNQRIRCFDTSNNYCGSGTRCYASVEDPEGITTLNNVSLTFNETYYNITLPTDKIGTYSFIGACSSSNNMTMEFKYDITYHGDSISQAQSTIYIILFVIFLFVFIITLFGIRELPYSNTQDEEGRILSISYLKYLRPVLWFFEWMVIIGILYVSSNIAFAYLNEQLFAQILFTFFRIAFGFTPLIVIVWMIWIFVSMFHDKQFQKMLNRGIFPEGRLP